MSTSRYDMHCWRRGAAALLLPVVMAGCAGPEDAGRKELVTGSFLSGPEVRRVADLMARDMAREALFYERQAPPHIAMVKVENDTNQYLFADARNAYMDRMRMQLKRALQSRVEFVDLDLERRLRADLVRWHPDEEAGNGRAGELKSRHGVEYLLGATFASLDKVIPVPDEKGKVRNQKVIELQMVFSMVEAETGELVWQNAVTSAAAFTTRDFQD